MVQKSILSYLLILALTLQKLCNAVVVANEMGSNKIMMIVSSDQHVTDNNDTVAEMTEIGILFGSENKSSCLDLSSAENIDLDAFNTEERGKEFDDDVFPTCAVLLKAEEVVGKPELNPIHLEVEGVVEKPSLHPVPLEADQVLEKPELRPVDVAFRLGFFLFILLFCTFLMMSAFEEEELQSAKHSEVAAVCNVIKHKGKKDAAKSKKKNVELPVGDQQNGSANEIMASTHC